MTMAQRCLAGMLILSAWAASLQAAELTPQEPIRIGEPAPDSMAVPPAGQPGMALEIPIASPLRIQRDTTEPMRVSPLSDPWVTAELERLKAQASRGDASLRGSKANTQRRRSAAEAAWWLGLIHFHGAGVQQNAPQARQWFLRAHELGHPLASAGLAMCEIDGCNSPPNPMAAQPWIDLLRRADAPRAMYLAWLAAFRMSPIEMAPGSQPGAAPKVVMPYRDQLLRAANAGDPHALIETGLELAAMRQWQDVLRQFQRAAPRSAVAGANAEAVREILARESSTPAVAAEKARRLLLEAIRAHRGEGAPANYGEALRLYREAEAAGSEEAGRMLALITSRPTPGGGINIEWMRQLAYVDLSQTIPVFGSPLQGQRLQREPSPLYDWLPSAWKSALTGAARR
ncbi:MAG: hypothetical protein ACLGG8_05745 [Gammaproteobacteria bacterium]